MDPGEEDLAIPVSNRKCSKKERNLFPDGKSTTKRKRDKLKNGDSSSSIKKMVSYSQMGETLLCLH